MYEQKIIENLREFSAKYQYEDQKLSETCFRAADAIEELQSQLPKWISVSERLPELRMWESGSLASSNVLFVTEDKTIHIGYVMEGFHIGDNGCLKIDRWFMQGGYRIENVTHWMPLPSTEGLKND